METSGFQAQAVSCDRSFFLVSQSALLSLGSGRESLALGNKELSQLGYSLYLSLLLVLPTHHSTSPWKSLWPSREGAYFPWSLIFGRVPRRSPLPEVVRATPTKSRGKNELLPSFARWEVGKCQLWVSLFFGWGIQDTLPLCYASHPEFPNHLAAFLASFRVLLCLFLMPFPGFIKLCLVGRSKEKVYTILSRPEDPHLLNFMSSLSVKNFLFLFCYIRPSYIIDIKNLKVIFA